MFKIVGEMKNGVVVEELEGGKRFPALATQQVSALKDISIYTEKEDMPLGDVFSKMKEKLDKEDAPGPKTDPEELKQFFVEVVPDYDQERVYTSDIKKVVRWYNALNAAGLVTLTEDKKDEKKEEKEKEGEKKTTKGKKADEKANENETPAEQEAEKEETPSEADKAEE